MDTREKVIQELDKRYNRLVGTSATNLCTHCGWCIESCHIFKATGNPEHSPVAKAEKVRRVLKRKHDWLSRLFPKWTGAKDLTESDLDEWIEAAFKNCTLCERCVINCPMGVETPQILATARGVLTAMGKSPEILNQLTDAAIAREEKMEMMEGFFRKQIANLEKQVQERMNDSNARIPVSEEADILYVPLSGAHTMVPAALIFNAAKANWTMSLFEASNYGVFVADIPKAKKVVERVLKEAKKVKAKTLVVTECGHAYGVLKWEAPKWFGKQFDFEVKSLLEVMNDYIQEGKIVLDPSKNSEPVTYHDPCNIGRKGGIFEEPRNVIQASSKEYKEMTPSKVENFCCGGGSGMVACSEWTEDRLLYGTVKVEQIKKTNAKKVVTACDNCLHQIKELGEKNNLNISVSNVSEHLANALVFS
ncbi:MAG: (Fe-S)-binding protein [Bacteroidia bacterium]|nr:(Fe-S)-binding protein [Bacteroidia bacterium]NNF31313.1 (Fe-S)-binding protein [Flavobacteriaceae bacterium]NNJ82143.1 (Fe-S)-binding protein [Flavobacteriaceae bacterium]NNK54235.1 (Fe-S)-binding protein [Flavobacteriaceae bacterium]